jgi:hypothetical protein
MAAARPSSPPIYVLDDSVDLVPLTGEPAGQGWSRIECASKKAGLRMRRVRRGGGARPHALRAPRRRPARHLLPCHPRDRRGSPEEGSQAPPPPTFSYMATNPFQPALNRTVGGGACEPAPPGL